MTANDRGLTPSLTVVKPGMLTTVHDIGRPGYQGLGVPVSGPMDAYSHRIANQVLGNDPKAAALEVTLLGPELLADGDLTCAVAGAEIELATGQAQPRPLVTLVHDLARTRPLLLIGTIGFEREFDRLPGQRLGFAVEHQFGNFRRLVARSHGPSRGIARPAFPEPAVSLAAHLFLHGIYRHRLFPRGDGAYYRAPVWAAR